MDMLKTKKEIVTQELSIWAIPNKYAKEGELPFEYEIKTYKAFEDGAVKVHTETITMIVPEGINLVAKAIETIEETKKEVTKEYNIEIKKLNEHIQNLQMLTYTSTSDNNEGELVD